MGLSKSVGAALVCIKEINIEEDATNSIRACCMYKL